MRKILLRLYAKFSKLKRNQYGIGIGDRVMVVETRAYYPVIGRSGVVSDVNSDSFYPYRVCFDNSNNLKLWCKAVIEYV